MRREIDGLVKSQVERVLNELEVVKREEFDAVKEMAAGPGRKTTGCSAASPSWNGGARRNGGIGRAAAQSHSTTPPSAAPPPFPATSPRAAPRNRV